MVSLNRIPRKLRHVDHLGILLESDGGGTDSARKILNLFKSYADK